MPLRRTFIPLIAMVSPSTIKAVPEILALVILLRMNRKMKMRGFICLLGISVGKVHAVA